MGAPAQQYSRKMAPSPGEGDFLIPEHALQIVHAHVVCHVRSGVCGTADVDKAVPLIVMSWFCRSGC